jgi:hypothetical protein
MRRMGSSERFTGCFRFSKNAHTHADCAPSYPTHTSSSHTAQHSFTHMRAKTQLPPELLPACAAVVARLEAILPTQIISF